MTLLPPVLSLPGPSQMFPAALALGHVFRDFSTATFLDAFQFRVDRSSFVGPILDCSGSEPSFRVEPVTGRNAAGFWNSLEALKAELEKLIPYRPEELENNLEPESDNGIVRVSALCGCFYHVQPRSNKVRLSASFSEDNGELHCNLRLDKSDGDRSTSIETYVSRDSVRSHSLVIAHESRAAIESAKWSVGLGPEDSVEELGLRLASLVAQSLMYEGALYVFQGIGSTQQRPIDFKTLPSFPREPSGFCISSQHPLHRNPAFNLRYGRPDSLILSFKQRCLPFPGLIRDILWNL